MLQYSATGDFTNNAAIDVDSFATRVRIGIKKTPLVKSIVARLEFKI